MLSTYHETVFIQVVENEINWYINCLEKYQKKYVAKYDFKNANLLNIPVFNSYKR